MSKQYNAADEDKVKQRVKELENERKQELEDIKNILGTPSGERFFKRFFEAGKIFSTSFTGNSTTFYNEGHRNFALIFLGDITEAAPEMLPKLLVKEIKE